MLLQTLKSVCWDAVPQKIQLELTLFNKANATKEPAFYWRTFAVARLVPAKRHSDCGVQGAGSRAFGVR